MHLMEADCDRSDDLDKISIKSKKKKKKKHMVANGLYEAIHVLFLKMVIFINNLIMIF